jgi:hypothetical protein
MSTFEYETEPLGEMESVLAVYYSGRGQLGEQYVVTNRRLLMGVGYVNPSVMVLGRIRE